MARSAAHYRQALVEMPETPAMRLGALTHKMLLSGENIAVFDGIRRGKEWNKFRDDHAAEEIYTRTELESVLPMIESVRSNPEASTLLIGGACEQTVYWHQLGRASRGTVDVLGSDYIAELKTTRCAEPERFRRDAIFRAYHAQLAWYWDGVIASGRGTVTSAYIIAVESATPYPVTVMRLTDRAIDQGRRLCRLWLERLLVCEASNQWPAYCESVIDLDVPDDLEIIYEDA
jgi:hypothetical protein